MKKKFLVALMLGVLMMTGCKGKDATPAAEISNESSTESADVDGPKEDSSNEGEEAASTEDGYYVVFERDGEKYPYYFYTDSNSYSKYDYSFTIGEPSNPTSFVNSREGEFNIQNFENGAECHIPTDGMSILHYDFDEKKDTEISEGYTMAEAYERFAPYADTQLYKYNEAVRLKKDDYSSDEFDYNKLILDISNYESVDILFRTADESESYDKSPMSTEAIDEYSTEEYEVNGYPVMIHSYTNEAQVAGDTDKPTFTKYMATVKLSDNVFVRVETTSALSTDDVKELVQKYVFDAMKL